MHKCTIASGLSLALLACAASAASGANSLCQDGEQIAFSCKAGKKLISVCASADAGPGTGYVQYRFGPANAPEISLPPAGVTPDKGAKSGTLMFSGGGGAYLRFANSSVGYVVYTGIGKGWEKAGVAVEKKGKATASIRCSSPAVSELGPEFFEKMGFGEDADDTEGFEIP